MTGRDGCAAEEAAAADRSEHGVRRRVVCQQLECRRALTGDDIKVVIRMYQGGAGTPDDFGGGGLPRLSGRLAEGNLSPVSGDSPLLYLRRRGGHDDIGLHSPRHGRMSQRSSMIARRMGDDTATTLVITQSEDGIGGSPELECPYLLKILTFEQEMSPGDSIQLPRGQDRSTVNKRRAWLPQPCNNIMKLRNEHTSLYQNVTTAGNLGVVTFLLTITAILHKAPHHGETCKYHCNH